MSTLYAGDRMTVDAWTAAYLEEVQAVAKRILDVSLLGLYATGSLSFGDFDRRRSDVDLMGVLRQPLTPDEGKRLQSALCHDRVPCPARGLDLSLVTADEAASPRRRPRVEFAMATGHTWKLERSDGEADGEFVVHFAICRQSGVPLCGPVPGEVFSPIPRRWLHDELAAILRWHAEHILDPYHDPLGQFSVLNACRAWYFLEHDAFCSKTAGGAWVLSQDPDNALVAAALSNRSGKTHGAPEKSAIEHFLRHVREKIEGAMGGESGKA